MKSKLAVVVSLLALTLPAAAQIAITPQQQNEDQTRPSGRSRLTPEEQKQFEEREQQRQEQQGRVRTPEELNELRTFEGRATLTGPRPGKCPPNGSIRATVRGSVIDASLTFPIERDAAHGFVSGSRFTAKGNFGYTFEGAMTDYAITGTVVKRQTVKPAEKPKPGVAIPFLPGPTTKSVTRRDYTAPSPLGKSSGHAAHRTHRRRHRHHRRPLPPLDAAQAAADSHD